MNELVIAIGLAVAVVTGAGLVLLRGKKGTPGSAPIDGDGDWRVITEPGPHRRLVRIRSRSRDAVVLEGRGFSATYAPADLLGATRPVLSRPEAEARLAELSTPASLDSRHGAEQHITFVKGLSRGSDAEVIAFLRARYARPWAPRFGDLKMLDQLEERLLPELALVLGRDEAALRTEVRSKHAVASATAPAPTEPTWPGLGSSEGVPVVEGLEPLGTVEWQDRVFIGPRLDRHAEPDSGSAAVAIAAGTWHAWLQQEADDEDPRALVLMRAGEERAWPPGDWTEVASTGAWALAPQAALQAMDEPSLTNEEVMDAARYLGGTNCFLRKAVSVALLDGLPEHAAIRAPRGASAPFRVLCIELRGAEADEDA